jgi:hypothetical protein
MSAFFAPPPVLASFKRGVECAKQFRHSVLQMREDVAHGASQLALYVMES